MTCVRVLNVPYNVPGTAQGTKVTKVVIVELIFIMTPKNQLFLLFLILTSNLMAQH